MRQLSRRAAVANFVQAAAQNHARSTQSCIQPTRHARLEPLQSWCALIARLRCAVPLTLVPCARCHACAPCGCHKLCSGPKGGSKRARLPGPAVPALPVVAQRQRERDERGAGRHVVVGQHADGRRAARAHQRHAALFVHAHHQPGAAARDAQGPAGGFLCRARDMIRRACPCSAQWRACACCTHGRQCEPRVGWRIYAAQKVRPGRAWQHVAPMMHCVRVNTQGAPWPCARGARTGSGARRRACRPRRSTGTCTWPP